MLYTRNSAGQILLEERQYANSDDYQQIYTYDEDGNELTFKRVYLEGDMAGVDQLCRVHTYDDCGNQLTETYFADCDDVVTQHSVWSCACFE